MKFSIAAFVFVLKAAISVMEVSSELQCDHDQLVCPLQNITCECVATGPLPQIIWTLHSEIIASFDHNGNCALSTGNCPATINVLENGLSSTLVFPAELQPDGPLTVKCTDEPPGPPVITMVIALNNSSASLSWTSPPYNCSLNYNLNVTDEGNTSVTFSDKMELTKLNVTTLNKGSSYLFRVASVDAAKRMSNWSQPVSLAMKVPAPVEFITVTIQVSSLIVEWKVNQLSSIPPVSHYVVYHNVTGDGDQMLIAYDTNVTISVTNNQFVASAIYVIQVAAVNVIGQGPVTKTTLIWILESNSVMKTASCLASSAIFVPTCEAMGSHYPLSVLLSAVCVSAVVFSALTALSTSVIVCLIMKKRQGKQGPAKATPIHAPVYDTITEGMGKENIELTGNVAYEQVTVQP